MGCLAVECFVKVGAKFHRMVDLSVQGWAALLLTISSMYCMYVVEKRNQRIEKNREQKKRTARIIRQSRALWEVQFTA